MDEVTYHNFKVGRASENLVKKYFEDLGHSVQITKNNGPDLIVDKEGCSFTVEVKNVSKVKGRKCWYVHEVGPKRKSDDFIAIVFSDRNILIEPMSEHLTKCTKTGKRVVTEYVHDKD